MFSKSFECFAKNRYSVDQSLKTLRKGIQLVKCLRLMLIRRLNFEIRKILNLM